MLDWWTQLSNLIYIVMGAVVGAFVLLVRKVFTNEQQIELLKAEINHRNETRKETDEKLRTELSDNRGSIDTQLKEIRHDIKNSLAGAYAYERSVRTRENINVSD